ncbi:MAG: hypothetical protein IPI34_07160 [bacterium]|nr:hypothetical protein [bacterium]
MEPANICGLSELWVSPAWGDRRGVSCVRASTTPSSHQNGICATIMIGIAHQIDNPAPSAAKPQAQPTAPQTAVSTRLGLDIRNVVPQPGQSQALQIVELNASFPQETGRRQRGQQRCASMSISMDLMKRSAHT